MSAGQLAQDVQRSAFPLRYDQGRMQALSLISSILRVSALRRLLASRARPLLAGCGVLDDEAPAPPPLPGDYGPVERGRASVARPSPAATRRPPAAVARALAAGKVGVVDVERAVGVRPRRSTTSSDGRSRAALARWGAAAPRARASCGCWTASRPARRAAPTRPARRSSSPASRRATGAALLRPGEVSSTRRTQPAELRAGAVLIAGAAAGRRGARGGRPRWPHSGHGERAISSPHQRQAQASTDCSSSCASPSASAGKTTPPRACRCPSSRAGGVGSTADQRRLPSAALTAGDPAARRRCGR